MGLKGFDTISRHAHLGLVSGREGLGAHPCYRRITALMSRAFSEHSASLHFALCMRCTD